jgi:hypothetical protein
LVKISHLLLSNFIVQTFSLHFSKQWAVLWIWKTISIIITMIWYVLTRIKSWHCVREHKNWKIISSFDCVTKMSGLNGFRLDPAKATVQMIIFHLRGHLCRSYLWFSIYSFYKFTA